MLILLTLSVFIPLVLSGVTRHEACRTSGWTDWGACQLAATHHATPGASFHADRTYPDVGAMRRALNMKRKILERYRIQSCREAGTCPWMEPLHSFTNQSCVDGMAGNFPCDNIHASSFLDITDLGYDKPVGNESESSFMVNDIWGWTDVDQDEDYVIVGLSGGASFVRITDPYNPQVLAFLPTETEASIWRDMKVINHYAYIVSEAPGHGLQVFDLHRLRTMSGYQGWIDHDGHYGRFGNAHNIVSNVETGYLYVVGATQDEFPDSCLGGLHMIDVNDPGNPVYAGCFDQDGYSHDAQCLIYNGPDSQYQGKEICFGYNEDSLTIVDVTDKTSPVMLSRTGYTGYGYTHQGWVTEDHTVLLLDDEVDEGDAALGDKYTRTYIWNIESLENPTMMSIYYSSVQSTDHNQYIIGKYTYQSNYMAGLRILEIDQQAFDLYEKAYFQLQPHEAPTAFDGTWSNYPYLPERNGERHVATTSIDFGLFLLKIDFNNFEATNHHVGHRTRSRDVLNKVTTAACPSLDEYIKCT